MKKKLLFLLVSGLLIIGTAGSAIATELSILNGPNVDSHAITGETIYVSPSVPYNIYLKVICGSDTPAGSADFLVTIERLDPNTLNVISLPPHLKATPDHYTGTLGTNLAPFVIASPVALQLTSDAVPGELYRVIVGNDQYHVSVTTIAKTIPEFPTVAAPVAGLLGLLFIFGRKKGDL